VYLTYHYLNSNQLVTDPYNGATVVPGGGDADQANKEDLETQTVRSLYTRLQRDHAEFKFGGEYRSLSSRPVFSLFPTGFEYYGSFGFSQTADPTFGYYAPGPFSTLAARILPTCCLGYLSRSISVCS
jgi:hypothetical protein